MFKGWHKSAQVQGGAALEVARPARHVQVIFALAAEDGLHGYVRGDLLMAYYLEACWEHGLEPLPQHTVLGALAQRTSKRRIRVDGRQRSYYKVPKRRKATR